MKAPYKTEDQIQAVRARAAKMRDAAKWDLMITLSYELGLRPLEIALAERNHFRDGEFRIRIGHTKGKQGRSLPISSEIQASVDAFMGERQGRVFLNQKGQPFDAQGVSKAMRRLYSMAGQVGSCYSGRRTAGQRMLEKRENILVIQAFYGHHSPLTTLSYLSVSENQLRQAMFGN